MASRAEQKAAARAAREAHQRQLSVAQMRRKRLYGLGAVLAGAVIALVIVIVAGSGGPGASAPISPKVAKATVAAVLSGIPQNGNTLGKASAPVTVTEYGDLVVPSACCSADGLDLGLELAVGRQADDRLRGALRAGEGDGRGLGRVVQAVS